MSHAEPSSHKGNDRIARGAFTASLAFALAACGGGAAAAPVETTPTETTPAETSAPTASCVTEADQPSIEAPSPFASLIAELSSDDARTTPLLTPSASIAACPRPLDEECGLVTAAAWSAATNEWVVLDVDASEGGPESAQLVVASPTGERVVATYHVDHGGITPLRRAVRPYASLAAPTNLVSEASLVSWSSSMYAPLVALSGPLDGWLLSLSTNDDLDHPEHVLSLIRRGDLHEVHELARRPAELAACDGNGWTCEAHPEDDSACTPADLRADDRLCVEPQNIDFVGIGSDGHTLLVTGIAIIAGDGGYPAHHWVVTIPSS